MEDIVIVLTHNLEKVGIGMVLFLCAYLANMGLGTWKSVKMDGWDFDWKIAVNSLLKFFVLAASIGLLSMVISVIPVYATCVGIEIEAEAMQLIDSLVIVSAFFIATVRYTTDAISKLKEILK